VASYLSALAGLSADAVLLTKKKKGAEPPISVPVIVITGEDKSSEAGAVVARATPAVLAKIVPVFERLGSAKGRVSDDYYRGKLTDMTQLKELTQELTTLLNEPAI